jgi:UrcA family protein
MTKLPITAALAASLSLLAVAPAAAESVPVLVTWGELVLATPAGAKMLAQRVVAA